MQRNAVLSITYRDRFGKLHLNEGQGKFYYTSEKPIYLADMTQKKWMRIGNGYAISAQILEAFQKAKVRPQIIYRRWDLGQLYITTPTAFKTKGIFGNWDNHRQYSLPIGFFDPKPLTDLREPRDFLPIISVEKWLKNEQQPVYRFEGNKAVPVEEPQQKGLFA